MPYPNFHSARIRNPGDFKEDSFRTKNIASGINIIVGRLKGKTTTTTQAYRFDKDKFTAAEAKKWLKDHDIKYLSFEAAKKVEKSMDQVVIKEPDDIIKATADDIKDYLFTAIKESFLFEKGDIWGVDYDQEYVYFTVHYYDKRYYEITYKLAYKLDGVTASLSNELIKVKKETIYTELKERTPMFYENGDIFEEDGNIFRSMENLFKKYLNINKSVISYKNYGQADKNTSWDAGKEVKSAEVEDLKKICAWYDSENPDVKGSYKLPHHRVSDDKAVWKGVAAAMGALLGARGGVDIPEDDKKKVYNHLVKHYKEFDKEPPVFKSLDDMPIIKQFEEEEMIAIEPMYCLPNTPDGHGEGMDIDTVYKMVESANKAITERRLSGGLFHKQNLKEIELIKCWVNECDCQIGESFVQEGQPIMKVKFHDEDLWNMRKNGELKGLSIGAKGERVEVS